MRKYAVTTVMCFVMMAGLATGCGNSHVKPVDMGNTTTASETTTEIPDELDMYRNTIGWANSQEMIQSVIANQDAKLSVSNPQQTAEELLAYLCENTGTEQTLPVYEFVEVTKPSDEENVLLLKDGQERTWKLHFSEDAGNLVPDSVEQIKK